ncbi:hypothetical protein VPHD239_0168 [Vibrio phage D239]
MIIAIEGVEAPNLHTFTESLQNYVDSNWDWDGTWRYEAGRFIAIVTKSKTPRYGNMELM